MAFAASDCDFVFSLFFPPLRGGWREARGGVRNVGHTTPYLDSSVKADVALRSPILDEVPDPVPAEGATMVG